MIKLIARKDALDPNRLGLISGAYPAVTPVDVRAIADSVIRFTASQALIDNVNSTEGGIVVRDALPDKDLLDGSATAIASRDWRQPVTGNYTTATGAPASAVIVYQTGRNSDNDRKTMTVWAFRNVGSGPNREGAILTINSLIARRTDVRLIDILQVQQLETMPDQTLYLITPWLFRRSDNANFLVVPNARVPVSSSKFDQIEWKIKIAESLGSNVAG